MSIKGKKRKTARTQITIDYWGPKMNESDEELLMEMVSKKITEGYTSGHDMNLYWSVTKTLV